MTVDVVCADPVFLDLTFDGLTHVPPPGSEYFARELHESPGGAATTAIGLARLGLRVAVTAPLGCDLAGQRLRDLLEAEGIACVGPESARTPVTVVLPLNGERAMVSFAPAAPRAEPGAIERLRPRAVVVNAECLALAPAEAAAYAVIGDPEADRLAGALPRDLGRARALIANRSEAERLTGERESESAARALAEHVSTAVVSCGPDGAVAACAGEVFRASAPQVDVVDTTGAGDLLAAAYIWADLAGLPLQDRLRHAVVYASLSVRTPTGSAGAVSLNELERAVTDAG
ncbi:MAG: carbohydrate kinase family protein [Gaiellaceae bacterium]